MSGDVYTDFLGQEIREGDYVVYATTSGRSPVQKLARVVKVSKQAKTRQIYDYKTRQYSTQDWIETKVGVKEIGNGRNFTRWDSYGYERDENGEYKVDAQGMLIRFDRTVRTTYPMPDNIVRVDFTPDSV